jgi:phosphoserine phosphatase RsbU/P
LKWVDEATGLLVGEVAEAYLMAGSNMSGDGGCCVIALAVDRLEAYRISQGEAVAARIVAQVARSIRASVATVGTVAAAYRNGMIVIVAPEMKSRAALEFGEGLRLSVSKLAIANPEATAADHVTVSVAVVAGRAAGGVDRMNLLTRAILAVPKASAAGGNRVVSESV